MDAIYHYVSGSSHDGQFHLLCKNLAQRKPVFYYDPFMFLVTVHPDRFTKLYLFQTRVLQDRAHLQTLYICIYIMKFE